MSITATHNRVARSLQWPALVMLVLVLAGCGDRLKWTEDVLLPDGRTVTLTRLQEFNGPPGQPFQPPSASYYRFEFVNPDTGEKVRWENNRDLATVALSINTKVPELLTTPQFGGGERYRCPDPPYLAFQYVGGEWVRVSLGNLALKVLRPNMTMWNVRKIRPYIEVNGHHLTTQQIQAKISDSVRGKLIDLTGLERQTFDNFNRCSPPFNFMTRDPAANE